MRRCFVTAFFEPRDVSQTSAHFMQINIATTNMEDYKLVLLICMAKKLQNRLNLMHEIIFFASRYKSMSCVHFLSI